MNKIIAITFMDLMFFGCSENTGNTSQPDDKISAVDNPNTETI